jgi:hypothetical protein
MKPWQRVLHGVAAAAFAFLAGLVVFAVAVALGLPRSVLPYFLGFLPVFQIALCAICIWKRTRYAIILPGLILCGGMVAYLIHDDPQRPPLPDLGPVAPSDSEGYKTYCWMAKNSPYSRSKGVQIEPLPKGGLFDQKKEKWRAYAMANREAIEQAWKNDQVGRDWIDALNQHPPSGVIWDGPDGRFDFQAVRAISNYRLSYAVCLAAEGHGDEAIRLLIPFIRASFFLQRSGVSMVNELIPTGFLNISYEIAGFILDDGKLSDDSRKELAAVLSNSPPTELILRNAILGDILPRRDSIDFLGKSFGILHFDFTHEDATYENSSITRFLQRLIFNPHLTERRCSDDYQEYFALLKARDFGKVKMLDESERIKARRFVLKNPVGRMLETNVVSGIGIYVKFFWKADDDRAALLKRLGAQ